MSTIALSASDPLRPAAESFVARLRRGERPTLAEYAERLPDQANRIRELFPRLLAAERRLDENQTTGPFNPIDDTHPIPKTIGDFHIVREIGRGGMGIVYEAVQSSLGRQVALKVLPHGPCSRGTFLERFRREARAAARLHHTNIVPVFGVGEADGLHFYAMQYIEGMGLDAVLKEVRRRRGLPIDEPAPDTQTLNLRTKDETGELRAGDFELGVASVLPQGSSGHEPATGAPTLAQSLRELAALSGPRYIRSVARLGVQIAEALAYAHDQGVLHRDVKPSNLLLDRHGILWITDFGLAKAEGEDLTGTGDIVGTVRYMAPERFQSRSDCRSDVYSLGMTMYEMIALRAAFDDDDRLRLVERIAREKPTPLRSLDRHVPKDLETIVLKSIHKDPGHRYDTAADLADDLRRLLTDRPIMARRATYLEEMQRWCRRNKAMTGLIGLVAMLWVLLVGVVVHANISLRIERDEVKSKTKFAETEATNARDQLWTADVATAQLHRSLRKVGQRFEALNALNRARRNRADPVLQKHAIVSMALPDLRRDIVWEGWPVGSMAVDVDPTFEHYARSDRNGVVTVRSRLDDGIVLQTPPLGGPARPQFSRTGAYVAVWYERDGQARVWRLNSDSPREIAAKPDNVVLCDFAAKDRWLACAAIDGVVTVYSLTDGQPTQSFAVGGLPTALAFHPTTSELAITVGPKVLVADVVTGEVHEALTAPSTAAVAWHPDGRRLAVGQEDGRILLTMSRGGEPLVLPGHRGGQVALVFSPDGMVLLSTGVDSTGTDRMLRMWDTATGRLLLAAPTNMRQVRRTADGRLIGPDIDEDRLIAYEMATGREYRTLVRRGPIGETVFRDGAVSPDGRWLAVATNDGMSAWDLRTGEHLGHFAIGDTVGCVFLPTGELLTSGQRGVFQWPISAPAADGLLILGPPRMLVAGPTERLARSRDGSVVAVATTDQGAVVLDPERPTIRSPLLSHQAAANVSVSPDGETIATGTRTGAMVRLWNTTNNRLIRELPIQAASIVEFSADGKWLATNVEGKGIKIWQTSDLTPTKAAIPGGTQAPFAWSPTASMMAVGSGEGSVRLFTHASDEQIAELADPAGSRASWLGFTPDGSRLIVISNDSQAVHVWNLAELSASLRSTGFGWTGPAFQAKKNVESVTALRLVGIELLDARPQALWTVSLTSLALLDDPGNADLLCRRGVAWAGLGMAQLALADYTAALRQRSDHGEASFLRGQEFLRLRDWEPALEDFNRALAVPRLADQARWFRGRALLHLDRVDELMSDVNRLIEAYPNDPQLYYQRALGHSYRDKYSAALADLELAVRHGPTHDLALNNLAWLLATGPVELRNPERALGLARRAMTLAPHKGSFNNTLGAALYRTGKFRDAIAAFDRSLASHRGQFDGYDLVFMAMCHAKLNEALKAQSCLERADSWVKVTRLNKHERNELDRFRQEADAELRELR